MTNPTSNYGWQMPTATDLVTDLPADFEVFGQAVDTALVDLLGGTTGQVLSKTSATSMDFTWVTPQVGDITGVTAGTGISGGGTSGTVTVTNDMATTITAAGDIVVGTGSGTYDNLPIGTTAQVLTADTTVSPYKVKWATAASGGMTLISTTSLSGGSTSITSIPQTYNSLFVIVNNLSTSGADRVTLRINSNSVTEYQYTGTSFNGSAALFGAENQTSIPGHPAANLNAAAVINSIYLYFPNYAEVTSRKLFQLISSVDGSINNMYTNIGGSVNTGVALTSLQIIVSAGTFDGGTISVYGVK